MYVMKHKGFQAKIMRAHRLIGEGEHSLPPGTAINVYPVDAFEAPLKNWLSGPGNYVVPVDSDWGLWFDWTMNDSLNTSVLLSIKGMNPVTGQRTNGFGLEQYKEKCPIHGTNFKDGLFCEECNYKWPDQNYIAHPNTLWWDGFRSADGKVRQFFFTEDLAKSIPELVIGKEDTVPAFGFAFFKPKKRREAIVEHHRGTHSHKFSSFKVGSSSNAYFDVKGDSSDGFKGISKSYSGPICSGLSSPIQIYHSNLIKSLTPTSEDIQPQSVNFCSTNPVPCSGQAVVEDLSFLLQDRCVNEPKKQRTSEVGVGAGAIISQGLQVDPLSVSDWEEEPSSVIRLNFVFIEQFEEIRAKGMKDLVGHSEGFLSNLPIG